LSEAETSDRYQANASSLTTRFFASIQNGLHALGESKQTEV